MFSDLHVSKKNVDVCMEVLHTVHREAVRRDAGILFLGKFLPPAPVPCPPAHGRAEPAASSRRRALQASRRYTADTPSQSQGLQRKRNTLHLKQMHASQICYIYRSAATIISKFILLLGRSLGILLGFPTMSPFPTAHHLRTQFPRSAAQIARRGPRRM